MTKYFSSSRIYLPLSKMLSATCSTLLMRSSTRVESYEKLFADKENSQFAMTVPMARIGLFAILKALKVQKGDIIYLSPVTIPEMLSIIEILELMPVFVDWSPNSLFPSLEDFKSKVVEGKRSYFLLTYIAGYIGDIESLARFCNECKIVLIQDCTQAVQCKFKNRSIVRYARFNFYSTCELKFIHTFRGGMICVDSRNDLEKLLEQRQTWPDRQQWTYFFQKQVSDLISAIILQPVFFSYFFRHLSKFIFTQDPTNRNFSSGVKIGPMLFFGNDCLEMKNRVPSKMLYRISNVEASLGLEALRRLDSRVRAHRNIAQQLTKGLEDKGLMTLTLPEGAFSSYWRFPILVADEAVVEEFRKKMFEGGFVAERTGLSLLSPQAQVAEGILKRLLFLPCHDALAEEDVGRIISQSNIFFQQ